MIAWWIAAALADEPDTTAFLTWADRQEAPRTTPEDTDGYHFSADLFPKIAAEVRAHPGLIDVELLGHSSGGRPIWAFHVEDGVAPPTRSVLVFANLHAMEWIGTEVAWAVLDDVIDAPPPGLRVTVIPVANPDGRSKVEDDRLAGRRWYRRGNGANIDLNRDFAVNTEPRAVWRHLKPSFYAHSDTPLSQPESQALDALWDREQYDRAASLHAFGGFFFYPWAGRFAPPPDDADFRALGRAMATAQGGRSYDPRQLGRWGFFFRAQGAEIDHLYGENGTRAFLIELTRSGITGWRSYRDAFRWYNPEDPKPHVDGGLRAVRALIEAPPTAGERAYPAGTPRLPPPDDNPRP